MSPVLSFSYGSKIYGITFKSGAEHAHSKDALHLPKASLRSAKPVRQQEWRTTFALEKSGALHRFSMLSQLALEKLNRIGEVPLAVKSINQCTARLALRQRKSPTSVLEIEHRYFSRKPGLSVMPAPTDL